MGHHVVLLGDSIFDNGAYVGRDPAVIDQVRAELPAGWRATLLAADGSVTRGVAGQLARLPADATHLVVSVGGNDALRENGLLTRPARSAADVLADLADAAGRFAADPIEPSAAGGAQIARRIRDVVVGHDFLRGLAAVYG